MLQGPQIKKNLFTYIIFGLTAETQEEKEKPLKTLIHANVFVIQMN